MTYRVVLTAQAQSQYKSLPPGVRRAVDKVIDQIRRNPKVGAKGWQHGSGDVVVLYTVDHDLIKITVLRIAHLK